MAVMHPLTLRFRDTALEDSFFEATRVRTRQQGQAAIVVGMFVYLLHGLLDRWFVSADLVAQLWVARGTALCVPAVVLVFSLTRWFARSSHLVLALVGLAAGVGLIAMQTHLPLASAPYYYPMMVVVTFYTYNFVGTRFIYALGVDLLMLVGYNLFFGALMAYPMHVLLGHDFFIVSANLIGGSAGYLAERQRRLLFLRERMLDEERQHHLDRSLHDGLTGLPNRDLLYDRIAQAMSSSQRNGQINCGFFLDLDGFKQINDTLGHKVGDQVLREVGSRLVSAVRGVDTVARIGGDEFFVIARDIASEADAKALALKLLDQISAPMHSIAPGLHTGASIGLCLFPYPGMTVADLIHRADVAMYRVKTSGKGNYAIAGAADSTAV
ncbi:diguanylate cyclase domain-containing protein [Niveibacterium sp.]|uniref:diguanylate cyclase domain-containing protein n=1 Tax=Niveibacterium sp. TaxID=2017444 RepID=UPI0035AEF2A1